ncbi:MFS transporter [Thermococcus sp. 21S9]|uniref:MFS transporter n=1 Tax=Thermococcus sp. 21S9 TaxID=1638223 RepID=UPI00143B1477|nr:MFS transporter [Thermococcus sp. 21S9]NJE55568.1 MFS transporter [Thermococcus sp. 21S9]
MNYVRRFYISSLLHLTFYSGFYLIYLRSLGLTDGQIGLLIGLSLVLVALLEVPTGVVADKISKKARVLLSKLLLVPGTLLLYLAHSFPGVLLATLFNSLAVAFLTGAETGWLYELLSRDGREGEYPKVYGRLRSFEMAGSFLGAVGGGFIAHSLGMRFAVLLSVPFALLSALILATVPTDTAKSSASYGRHLLESLRFVRNSPEVLWLFIYANLIGLPLTVFTSFIQLYFYGLIASVIVISWISAGYTMISGISWYFDFGEKLRAVIYRWSPVLIPSLTLLAGLNGYLGFLTLVFGSLLFAQVFKEWQGRFQRAIPDEKRATIGSFYSLFTATLNGGLNTLAGWLYGRVGIMKGLILLSVVFLLLGAGTALKKER